MQVTVTPMRRSRPPQVRGEERRDELRKILSGGPMHFREVVRRSGIPAGCVRHHLDALARRHEASWQNVGQCIVWNLGAQPCTTRAAIEAIATPHQLEVLRLARTMHGQSQGAVIDALPHRVRSSVQHALTWCVQHGLLRYHLQGRYKLVQAC